MPDTHERTKTPSFGRSSEADATSLTGTKTQTPRAVRRAAPEALTALWPAPRSPGSRCPFCSGPSSAPAGLGWASVLPQPGLQNRWSVSEGAGTGLFPESPAAAHGPHRHSHGQGDDGGHGSPSAAAHAGAPVVLRATAASFPRLSDEAHGPPRPHPRALQAVPFAHVMVLCRTWYMADTVFSQATCRGQGHCLLPLEAACCPQLPTAAHSCPGAHCLCSGTLGLAPSRPPNQLGPAPPQQGPSTAG